MIIVYMIKISVNMQLLLCLETCESFGFGKIVIKWWESRKLEIKFVYLIVMIFGMNHGYEMLDDHFELI